MDTQVLNARKNELLNQQTAMLKKAYEAKVNLTKSESDQFDALTAEIDSINADIRRHEVVNKGKLEIATPAQVAAVTGFEKKSKFSAFAGKYKSTPLSPEVDDKYVANFWKSLKSPASFQNWMIQNAALGEGGTAADGSALVPIETDPTIPYMAIEECSARQLSRVIPTERNINLPYQSLKTVAATKAESNNSSTNNFSTNVPQFSTTELQAWMVGNTVIASWELLEDAKAANAFIPFDLQRAITAKEENLFINGTGSSQPQGYLGNATTASGVDAGTGTGTLSINALLDVVGDLNRAYYANAKWLVNRQEFNRLLKKQIAASQYQVFVTWEPNGDARLFGYPVEFSGEMPVYSASPSVTGAWLFGDFTAFATIGDRGDSNIRIKVDPYTGQQAGQTYITGYRRVDQRILIQEAVIEFQTNG